MAHDTLGKAFFDSAKLRKYMKDRVLLKLLKGQLPLPQVPVATVPQELTDSIQNMADLLTNREEQEEPREVKKATPRDVSDYYTGAQLAKLFRICQVNAVNTGKNTRYF